MTMNSKENVYQRAETTMSNFGKKINFLINKSKYFHIVKLNTTKCMLFEEECVPVICFNRSEFFFIFLNNCSFMCFHTVFTMVCARLYIVISQRPTCRPTPWSIFAQIFLLQIVSKCTRTFKKNVSNTKKCKKKLIAMTKQRRIFFSNPIFFMYSEQISRGKQFLILFVFRYLPQFLRY